MQRRAFSFTSRFVLAALAVLCCGCLLLWLLARAAPDESIAARALWQANRLTHYRLVVQEDTPAGSCRQELHVQDEQIESVQANHCGHVPSWTISNLFAWSAHFVEGPQCYPTNVTCVCYRVYSLHTTYDPKLGYPQQRVYQWITQPNWGYRPHWERLFQNQEWPDCRTVTRQDVGYVRISVVTVTPLP